MSQQAIDGPEARGEDATEKLTLTQSQLNEANANEDLGSDQNRPTVSDTESESETDDDSKFHAEKDDETPTVIVYILQSGPPSRRTSLKVQTHGCFTYLGCKTCSKVVS